MTGRQITIEGPPQRIQLRRTKGWRLPDGACSVARPTRWGNPFRIGDSIDVSEHPWTRGMSILGQPISRAGKVEDAGHAVDLFIMWVMARVPFTAAVVQAELGGRDLACYCPVGTPCHGDVLLEIANGRTLT